MRRRPWAGPGLVVDASEALTRLTGLYNVILFSDFSPEEADDRVRAQADHFRKIGERVEWKVHGHDRPADLGAWLAAAGFVPDEAETIMVMGTEAVPRFAAPDGVRIEVTADAKGVDDFLSVTTDVFADAHQDLRGELIERLAAGTASMHVAYAGDTPVGAGRLDLPPGRAFAGAYAGAVLAAHRGRGVYRALVSSRADLAVSRGYRYLYSECLGTSRPILARAGFAALTTVQGWVLEPSPDRI